MGNVIIKNNKLNLPLRISKRFILVTSLYHKRVSIGLLCKDEKCTIRNKCEISIIICCCYQSWKKLAIELLLNLSKNLSVKAFEKGLRNKNHPTSSFQKQEPYLLRLRHLTKIAIVMFFISSQILKNTNQKILTLIIERCLMD